jgi:hypothetical protein
MTQDRQGWMYQSPQFNASVPSIRMDMHNYRSWSWSCTLSTRLSDLPHNLLPSLPDFSFVYFQYTLYILSVYFFPNLNPLTCTDSNTLFTQTTCAGPSSTLHHTIRSSIASTPSILNNPHEDFPQVSSNGRRAVETGLTRAPYSV